MTINALFTFTFTFFVILPTPSFDGQVDKNCVTQIEFGLNALSTSLIYYFDYREVLLDYFKQWDSESIVPTTLEDYVNSMGSKPASSKDEGLHLIIDSIFKSAFKPSLGFPYQYHGIDILKELESDKDMVHSLTGQQIKMPQNVLQKSDCEIHSLQLEDNEVLFGPETKSKYLNILVSDYYLNDKYACFEFALIPSRNSEVLQEKINFDSYYAQLQSL